MKKKKKTHPYLGTDADRTPPCFQTVDIKEIYKANKNKHFQVPAGPFHSYLTQCALKVVSQKSTPP